MHDMTVREIEIRMEELRAIEPGESEARAAVERAMGAAASRRERSARLLAGKPAGALAAAVVIVGAVALWSSIGVARAAGRLQAAAEAVRGYSGWICVRARVEGKGEAVSYLDTATGASAWVDDPASPRRAVVEDPAHGVRWDYQASAGEIRITRVDALAAEEHRRATEQMLSVEGLTGALKVFEKGANIRGARDGEMDRYEVTMAGGRECSVWVNRKTGLIERIHGSQLFCFGTDATISYGGPGVTDVYGLGVPRGTPMVDDRLPQRPAAHGGRATLDREALLQLVRAERMLMRDLSVTAKERTEHEVPGMYNRTWYSTTVAGERMVTDYRIDQKLEGDRYAVRRRISFDGRQTVFWSQPGSRDDVMVFPGHDRQADLQAEQWFALNLLCPPKAGMNGVDDQSMESLLASGLSRVRPDLEEIDGRWCHVVEAPGGTFWLDVERGCVPLKQEYANRADADRPMMTFTAERVEQVKGMWFVTRGRKELSLPKDARMQAPELEHAKWTIEAERNADGSPAIRVNEGEGAFDLLRTLPPGVEVHRMEK